MSRQFRPFQFNNSNRAAVSLRFNLAEQDDLMKLCAFWNKQDPRDLIRFAISQLKIGTDKIAKEIAAKQESENASSNDNNADAGNSDSADSSAPAGQETTDTPAA